MDEYDFILPRPNRIRQRSHVPPLQHPSKRSQSPAAPPLAPKESAQQLTDAITQSQDILFTATTVFPFTLFPDTITIDREKVTIAERFFFRVAEVSSIRIEDILNVTADVGPLFGCLKIHNRFFDVEKPNTVNYLWRGDALRLKRILQGYVIATQKGIDCSAFGAKQLARLLDDLGQGAPNKDM